MRGATSAYLAEVGVRETLHTENAYAGLRVARIYCHTPQMDMPATNEILLGCVESHLRASIHGLGPGYRQVAPGETLIVPAGLATRHQFDRSFYAVHVRLDQSLFEAQCLLAGVPAPLLKLSMVQDKAMSDSIHALVREAEAGCPSGAEYGEGVGRAILARLGAIHAEEAEAKENRPRLPKASLAHVIEIINDRLSEDLTIDELAREARYSKWHFQRLFKSATGESVHEYVTRIRVNHADELLRTGSSVQSAARSVGFADASHLSRHFRDQFGITPGMAAKRARL